MTTRGRRWSSTAHTRQGVLAAATDVFRQHGYAATTMADIARAADVSIGSLYHHFAGKYELFLAVWRAYDSANQHTASAAVAAARQGGHADAPTLFVVGLRAYLLAGWADLELARLFADGDTPPGFARAQRQADELWVHDNLRLLDVGDRPADRMLLALLASFLEQSRREIATARAAAEADELLDTALELMRHMRGLIMDRIRRPLPVAAAQDILVG